MGLLSIPRRDFGDALVSSEYVPFDVLFIYTFYKIVLSSEQSELVSKRKGEILHFRKRCNLSKPLFLSKHNFYLTLNYCIILSFLYRKCMAPASAQIAQI